MHPYRNRETLTSFEIDMLRCQKVDENFVEKLDEGEVCPICHHDYKAGDEILYLMC